MTPLRDWTRGELLCARKVTALNSVFVTIITSLFPEDTLA